MLNYSVVSNSNTVLTNWLNMGHWINLRLWESLFSCTLFLSIMILFIRTCMNTCGNLWLNFTFFIVVVPMTHGVLGLYFSIYWLQDGWLLSSLVKLTTLSASRLDTFCTELILIHEWIWSESIFVSDFTSVGFRSELCSQLLIVKALFLGAVDGICSFWRYSVMRMLSAMVCELLNTRNGWHDRSQCSCWWMIGTLMVYYLDHGS